MYANVFGWINFSFYIPEAMSKRILTDTGYEGIASKRKQ